MKLIYIRLPLAGMTPRVDVALSAVQLVVVGAAWRLHQTRENMPGKSPVCL
jgi:hypothetical protein